MKEVNMDWVAKHILEINLIDVRSPEEYKEESIPGSKNIPMAGLILNSETFLDKSKTYYVMCRSGGRSSRTASALIDKGYDVINVKGGILAYKK